MHTRRIRARLRENIRENTRQIQYARTRDELRGYAEYAANTLRIRENTQEYAGYAASTRANTHQYAANTQVARMRRILTRIHGEYARIYARMFTDIT